MAEGLPDFRNPEAIETWLRTQPEEMVLTLAARAALRVLPIIATESRQFSDNLPCHHFAILAWSASIILVRAADFHETGELQAATCAATTALSDLWAPSMGSLPPAARAVWRSFDASLRASASTTRRTIAENAALAFSASYAAAPARASSTALAADAFFGSSHGSSRLGQSRLWHASEPEFVQRQWHKLIDQMRQDDPSWEVWVDWYEDCRVGWRIDLSQERKKALIPEALWNGDPHLLNAEVAKQSITDTQVRLASNLQNLEIYLRNSRNRLEPPSQLQPAANQGTSATLGVDIGKSQYYARRALSELRSKLRAVEAHQGGMGHNLPPVEIPPQQLENLEASVRALEAALAAQSPNFHEIAATSARVAQIFNWLGKKLDLFSNELASSSGKSLGKFMEPKYFIIITSGISLYIGTDTFQTLNNLLEAILQLLEAGAGVAPAVIPPTVPRLPI